MSNNSAPFGTMTTDPIHDISLLKGVGARSSMWLILEAFVRQNEAVASRVSFGRTGAIILTTIPGDPNSGAFYLYDSNTNWFYSFTFENQDSFNVAWFDMVVTAYDLQDLIDMNLGVEKKPVQQRSRRRRRGHHGNNRHGYLPLQQPVAA
jgi:hypothetical protein